MWAASRPATEFRKGRLLQRKSLVHSKVQELNLRREPDLEGVLQALRFR